MEAGQHVGFLFESIGGEGDLAGTEVVLAHFFDGDQAVSQLCVLRFVDRAHASHTNLANNLVALVEDGMDWQRSGGIAYDDSSRFWLWRLPALDANYCLR
jgi:hypothetical protein